MSTLSKETLALMGANPWTTAAGVNQDDILISFQPASGERRHIIEVISGAVRVEVSLDGVNFVAVYVQPLDTATPTTLVASLTTIGVVEGVFTTIRLAQAGLLAAQARGLSTS